MGDRLPIRARKHPAFWDERAELINAINRIDKQIASGVDGLTPIVARFGRERDQELTGLYTQAVETIAARLALFESDESAQESRRSLRLLHLGSFQHRKLGEVACLFSRRPRGRFLGPAHHRAE